MVSASEIVAKLNLTPHPEGGFYYETFRDTSIVLSKSQLPPECKFFHQSLKSFFLKLMIFKPFFVGILDDEM
jgi:predicted cupin superfamily sugar epimerase